MQPLVILLSKILSFFSNFKENLVLYQWILIIVLIGAVLGFKSCSDNKEEVLVEYQTSLRSTLKSQEDKHQEEILNVKHRRDQQVALLSEDINKAQEKLGIKDREINHWKTIALTRTTTDTITEYKTVYDFIEINPEVTKNFRRSTDCYTIEGEFTEHGLELKTESHIAITDISYFKRRKFLKLPIGKKEYFQTLVTNCSGDTITKNQKIEFKKL
jgi:hypothetical protein